MGKNMGKNMGKKENEIVRAHQGLVTLAILILLALTLASHFRNWWEFPVQDAEAAPSKIELFRRHAETAKALIEEVEYLIQEMKLLKVELEEVKTKKLKD